MDDKKRIPAIRFKGFTDSWEQRKLGDVVQTRRGLTYSPGDIAENGIRVLRSSNINEDTFEYGTDDVFVNPSAVNIEPVKQNDILITSANGSSKLVGKHALIKEIPDNSAVHGGFMLLGRAQNYEFINASMSSHWYTKFISVFVSGGNGAIGNLSKKDLDEQVFQVPGNSEQVKVGLFFNNLDNLITLHQRKCFLMIFCRWGDIMLQNGRKKRFFRMSFTSEKDFENELVTLLGGKGWDKKPIMYPTERVLLENWKRILYVNNNQKDRLGEYQLTDGEMAQIIEKITELKTPYRLNGFINGKTVTIKRDNLDDGLHFGKEISLDIFDRDEIAAGRSVYQIARQPVFHSKSKIDKDRRGGHHSPDKRNACNTCGTQEEWGSCQSGDQSNWQILKRGRFYRPLFVGSNLRCNDS